MWAGYGDGPSLVGWGVCVWIWFVLRVRLVLLVTKGPRTNVVYSEILRTNLANFSKLSLRDQTCQVNITQGPKVYNFVFKNFKGPKMLFLDFEGLNL